MEPKKRGYLILMADKNIDDHNSVKNAARECGINHVFTSVYNGAQLMDYLTRKGAYMRDPDNLPDLLIMDIHLDLVSGFDILALLMKNEKYKNLPVFVLTKTIKEEEKVRARGFGIRDYFQKPLDRLQWNKMVGDICQQVFLGSVDQNKRSPS